MINIDLSIPQWLIKHVEGLTPECEEIYLVGGAIRNLIRETEIDDFDFVVKTKPNNAARYIANQCNGDFYILDRERQTARAIIEDGERLVKLDFALINGGSIEKDLAMRDFTINAMAIAIPFDNRIIDPTGGIDDLTENTLRPCSATSFIDDPVRTIRYIRFLFEMGMQATAEVEDFVKQAVPLLARVSPERQRDALLDVIKVANAKAAFNEMRKLGLISRLFPGAEKLPDVELSLPHTYNGWDHTMHVIQYSQQFLMELDLAPSRSEIHPRITEAIHRLARYHDKLHSFFLDDISSGSSKYQLLILSAFFHDLAKGIVEYEFKEERKKFPGHARRGAQIVKDWARKYSFSNKEIFYLESIVRTHMKVSRPEMIASDTKNVSIFRFFRRAGDAGILTAILHLADVLTTYENALDDARWDEALMAVDGIFNAYFFHYEELIDPPLILNGKEVMELFNLKPSRKVGELLALLQEAQVSGVVSDRQQGQKFLKELVDKQEGQGL